MTVVHGLLVAAALLFAWAVATFNMLIRARNRVEEAWSGVDVQLKRRHELVPNLVEVVRGYAAHERVVLGIATEMRVAAAAAAGERRRHAESELSAAIAEVCAVAERYPELSASEIFRGLERALAEVEAEIRAARAIYNSNVELYNALVQSVPSSLMARPAGFRTRRFFEMAPSDRQPPRPLSLVA
jgi:LemA protein